MPPPAAPQLSFSLRAGSSGQLLGEASSCSTALAESGEHRRRQQHQHQQQPLASPFATQPPPPLQQQQLASPFATQQAQQQRPQRAMRLDTDRAAGTAGLTWPPAPTLQLEHWGRAAAAMQQPVLEHQASSQQLIGMMHSAGSLHSQQQLGAPPKQVLMHSQAAAPLPAANAASLDAIFFQRGAQPLKWSELPLAGQLQPPPPLPQPQAQQAQQSAPAGGMSGRSGSLPSPLQGVPRDLLLSGEPRLTGQQLAAAADLLDLWQADLVDDELLHWIF